MHWRRGPTVSRLNKRLLTLNPLQLLLPLVKERIGRRGTPPFRGADVTLRESRFDVTRPNHPANPKTPAKRKDFVQAGTARRSSREHDRRIPCSCPLPGFVERERRQTVSLSY